MIKVCEECFERDVRKVIKYDSITNRGNLMYHKHSNKYGICAQCNRPLSYNELKNDSYKSFDEYDTRIKKEVIKYTLKKGL